MELKAVIIDDEEAMRSVLKRIINKTEGVIYSGEAADGESAVQLIDELRPDIVFMDVEMPRMDGIECARRIFEINPGTIIIFATAHCEYMAQAFEIYAFDYLIKPFKIERVVKTLERIKEVNRQKAEHSINYLKVHKKGLDKLVIKNKDGISFVDMEDIIIIQRENRSTVIYTADDRYTTSEGLSDIEEKLDKSLFFRSHKSYIINLSMIHKVNPYGRWTFIVKLKNTAMDALITHDKYEELQRLFGLNNI